MSYIEKDIGGLYKIIYKSGLIVFLNTETAKSFKMNFGEVAMMLDSYPDDQCQGRYIIKILHKGKIGFLYSIHPIKMFLEKIS